MPNNLLRQSDNLSGLQYLLDNGFKGKIDSAYIDQLYATGRNFIITIGRAITIGNSKKYFCKCIMKTTHTIINGDVRQMSELEDKPVHLTVTLPPYQQVKNYGADNRGKRVFLKYDEQKEDSQNYILTYLLFGICICNKLKLPTK